MSDIERSIAATVGRVITNSSNWPKDIAPHVWGRDLAEPIDKISTALLPVIEQVRADAKREALMEAADYAEENLGAYDDRGAIMSRDGKKFYQHGISQWLRARAAGL